MKKLYCILLLGCMLMVAIGGWAIYAQWSHAPIIRSGETYILQDTYNNHMGTISLNHAEMIHKNQSGMYEIWQYEANDTENLLNALSWNLNEMNMDNEVAQFAISRSDAEEQYLPEDRTQTTYYFCVANNRTHDYVHLYFYPEVTLGNGEQLQNILLIMREY